MVYRVCFRSFLVGLVFTLAGASVGRADEQSAIARLVALNKEALAAYGAGDYDKARSQLLEGFVLAKENGLGEHPMLARTYLHLGIVYIDGYKEEDKGIRYFTMALKIQPNIEVTRSLATKTVSRGLARARGEDVPPEPPVSPTPVVTPAAAAATPSPADKKDGKLRVENERLRKELAQAKEREKKDRDDKERLFKETQDKDKQLGEARERLLQAGVDRDKLIADAKERIKKERDEKERLGEQLTEARHELAQAKEWQQKETVEQGKLLADAMERESKEREARAKLEKEKQAADVREAARKNEQIEREKLLAGPDRPDQIPEPLFCPVKDEAQPGHEIVVHCAAQAGIKANAAVLYYRPSGVAQYNAFGMDRSKKGWFVGIIPASKVMGKTLQYYVQARDARDEAVAHNARADSPNLILLRANAR